MDHTPMITGPPAVSIARPAQSAQRSPTAPYNQYIIVLPTVSAFAPPRSAIPPPNPYFNYPHLTASAAPSTERRIFPRWNQTTAHPLNAPIPTRPTPTSSTHFDPLQPTALATTSVSASTTSNAPTVPADPEEAIRMGWPVVTLGDICPCNLDGHHCMLPVRCRYLKNKICTKKVCGSLYDTLISLSLRLCLVRSVHYNSILYFSLLFFSSLVLLPLCLYLIHVYSHHSIIQHHASPSH